jgi:hypothetical protein
MAKELKQALIKLHVENRGIMWPGKCEILYCIHELLDWLYSMYHYSHPPIMERLEAMGGVEETEETEAVSPQTEQERKEHYLFKEVLKVKH